MNAYVLKNVINGQIIDAFDTEASAVAQKSNLLKTGEYRKISIELVDVKSTTVTALEVVRVEGYMTPAGPKVSVFAYNPASPVTDAIAFTVTSRQISFAGYINLTADEQTASDTTALIQRISAYVESEFAIRVTNDNPVI